MRRQWSVRLVETLTLLWHLSPAIVGIGWLVPVFLMQMALESQPRSVTGIAFVATFAATGGVIGMVQAGMEAVSRRMTLACAVVPRPFPVGPVTNLVFAVIAFSCAEWLW